MPRVIVLGAAKLNSRLLRRRVIRSSLPSDQALGYCNTALIAYG